MARPRLGQFSFNPYQPEIDEDLQNELLAAASAPNPLASFDESEMSAYGLDENDPEAAAAYMRLKNRKRDPAMYENPNAPVGARISDLLTGIGAVMQRRSPLQDIDAAQSGRLAQQRRMQEQALGEEKLDISNLMNLARMRQAKSQLDLKRRELEERPEREKARQRARFEEMMALQSAISGRQVDMQKARQQFEEGLKAQEREFRSSQFEKEADLRRELEATKQRGAGERQAKKASAAGAAKEGKPPTEFQSKFALYSKRLEMAENSLGGLMGAGFDPASAKNTAFSFLPELAKPEDVKEYENIKENFVSAILRPESGAAISKSEQQQAKKQYFPAIGDTPRVIEQKRLLRQQVINGMKSASGKAYGLVETVPGQAPKNEQKTLGGVKYEKRSDGKWYPVQ